MVWIVAGCLTLASVACFLFLPREPRFQGKALSAWLEDYGQSRQKNQEIDEAVRQMGSEALPWLVERLERKDSALKLKFVDVAKRLRFIKIRFMPAEEHRKRAAWAMLALGKEAKPVLPELVRLLDDTQTVAWATAAISGLGWDAVPVLARQMTNRDDQVRRFVSSMLLKLCLQPGAENHREEVVPLLLQNLSDSDYTIRSAAAGALSSIADPSTAIPALMVNLRDTNNYVRAMTAQALGRFGTNAAAAAPTLLELSRSQDTFLRDRAVEALKRITPEGLNDLGNQE